MIFAMDTIETVLAICVSCVESKKIENETENERRRFD